MKKFVAFALTLAILLPCAYGQSPKDFLRGIRDAAGNAPATGKPAPVSQANASPGVQPVPLPGPVVWRTREEFIAATRAGKLMEISIGGADNPQVLASIMTIMYSQYGVRSIDRDCYETGGFKSQVIGLLSDIAEMHAMTLNSQPPDFTDRASNRSNMIESVNSTMDRLSNPRDPDYCDGGGLGRRAIPHPYKAALVQLATEYSKATEAVIEEERANRVKNYQRRVARRHADEQQRQAAIRAEEQRRIDAEAARIRADEQRRAQKDKARVGG